MIFIYLNNVCMYVHIFSSLQSIYSSDIKIRAGSPPGIKIPLKIQDNTSVCPKFSKTGASPK